jgi:hypothetical protein
MPRFGKNLRNLAVVAAFAAFALGVSACDDTDNPNSPSNPNAPVIASIGPTSIVVGGSVQTITITGQRFSSGLTILLDAPNGVWTTYGGDSIAVQSDTQFTAKVMLDKTGVWDVTVHNPDGLESNEVQFTVVAASGQ